MGSYQHKTAMGSYQYKTDTVESFGKVLITKAEKLQYRYTTRLHWYRAFIHYNAESQMCMILISGIV